MHSEIKTQRNYIQNDLFRARILGHIMIVSVIFTLFFALLHSLGINHISDEQAINNYIHASFVLPAYYFFQKKRITLEVTAHYFLVFCFITSTCALLFAENDAFRAIWFFLSTMISYIFLGRNFGRFYGGCSFIFIAFAGFGFENNLNSESVLSILISLLVLILVMSAYTNQMEQHLNHIEKIQQELYYLANKSPMSHTLNNDKQARKIEALFNESQEKEVSLSLMYIEIDDLDSLKNIYGADVEYKIKTELIKKLKSFLTLRDIIAKLDQLIYVVLPERDSTSIKELARRLDKHFSEFELEEGDIEIPIKLCTSFTQISSHDASIRSMHIRADKGLTKALAMGGTQTVFVDI